MVPLWPGWEPTRGKSMTNNDRVKGAAKNAGGKIKETIGKVTGDKRTQAEGKKEQAAGKVQETYGRAKDKAREQ